MSSKSLTLHMQYLNIYDVFQKLDVEPINLSNSYKTACMNISKKY